MGYSIDCFKKYEIRNMMNYTGDYEFKMIDYKNGDYVYPSTLLKIYDYLVPYGLHDEWQDIIPNYGETYFENITKEEVQYIESRLMHPSKCLEFIKSNKIIDIIVADKPEDYQSMVSTLAFLMEYWKEGYYAIITY